MSAPPQEARKLSPALAQLNGSLETWLVDSVKDYAIFMLDAEGRVASWNPGAELIKGYTSEEILGKHFSSFYTDEDIEDGKPQSALRTAATEGRYQQEGWRVRKDGSRFWAEVTITAVRDEDGQLLGFAKVTRDVTERREAEQALRQSEQRFRLLVDSVKDHALFMLDPEGRVESWNAGAEQLLGYGADEIVGKHLSCFYTDEDVQHGKPAWDLEAAAADGQVEEEGWRVCRDGTRFWAEVAITAVYDEEERVRGFAQVTRDVTERARLLEQLEHQALHDALTGLPNRTLFIERLRLALARLERHPSTAAVLFMDVDRFKMINDSLGHEVGDQLLVALAERLERVMRPHDTVARFGGDELAILCEDLDDEQHAAKIAKRVVRALKRPLPVKGREMVVSSSIGIAVASEASADPERLISDADAAMYRAKAKGRGTFELFDEAMRARAMEQLETELALRRALQRRELRLFFQPVVRLDGGTTRDYEALVRWEHPERGLLLPKDFVPLAEETGLIVPIGQWVLEEACRHAAEMRRQDHQSGGNVSVNISFVQVAQPELPRLVADALESSGAEPHMLCLELTESVLMEDAERAQATLKALKEIGVRLALDDFGTGYSSLGYLHRFPVDTVKIDRAFVSGLDGNRDGSAIVAVVLRIGDVLGLDVVAEGVETAAQLLELRALGCRLGQGYYFAPPRPPEAAFS